MPRTERRTPVAFPLLPGQDGRGLPGGRVQQVKGVVLDAIDQRGCAVLAGILRFAWTEGAGEGRVTPMAMRFRLARLTATGRLVTGLVAGLPVLSALRAWWASPPQRLLFAAVALLGALALAVVALGLRPLAFEVAEDELRIRWPLRTRRISRRNISDVLLVSGAAFRREQGRGLRLGAGGFGGSFGRLVTDRETFSLWISRADPLVVVRLRGDDAPLLITPEQPSHFVEALRPLR